MGKAIIGGGYVVSARQMNPIARTAAAEAAAKPLNLLNFTASSKTGNAFPLESFKCTSRSSPVWGSRADTKLSSSSSNCRYCFMGIKVTPTTGLSPPRAGNADGFVFIIHSLDLGEMGLDPATAKLAIGILGPFLSAFAFLFIIRIVMSWYPKLPVGKFPYAIAYAPTEPLLIPTRKLIPPLAGVDVTPVVWFGLLTFLNEILLGPQGLLLLVSQQL